MVNNLSSLLQNKNRKLLFLLPFTAIALLPARASAACVDSVAGGAIPTWHKYLTKDGACNIQFEWPNSIIGVAAAFTEILFVLGGIVAVLFIIVGGFQFIISRGEPDKIAGARRTILNALVGLVLTIMAVSIVRLVAGAF
jgi:hypothetical protein